MSTDQITLIPSFIIYLNGRRLEMEEEYSVQKIRVNERLNSIASATVVFSDPNFELQKNNDFSIGSELSVTMGYKDNVKALFTGEIIKQDVVLKRDKPAAYRIEALNRLQRLKKNNSQIVYYEMTDFQIIQKIAENVGIDVVSESFGKSHPIFVSPCLYDYNLLEYITRFHGYDFYLRDTTLFIEKHSSRTGSDVILEWGKSLVELAYKDDVVGQITEAVVSSVDPRTGQGYTSRIDSKTIKGAGPVIMEEFTPIIYMTREEGMTSSLETEARAEAIFVQYARQFQNIRGICEGNMDIVAGGVVQIKGVAKRVDKEFLVNDVSHILEADKGYRTEFHLVSNVGFPGGKPAEMAMSDEAQRNQSHEAALNEDLEPVVYVSSSGTEENTEENENEKNPQIFSLIWKDESGQSITSAHVGQNVVMTAQVQDIDDGETLKINLIEKDSQGEDDLISTGSVKVTNAKIEYNWNVEYVNDDDDVKDESEEGYSMPEFVFTVETSEGACIGEESPLLDVKNWIFKKMIDDKSDKSLANKTFEIVFKDGSSRKGVSDDQGIICEVNLPYMDYSIIVSEG